jgi:alkaline phosphatase D
VTRRGFLAGTVAAALAACSESDDSSEPTSGTTPPSDPATTTTSPTTTSTPTAPATTATKVAGGNPFTLGVASGDPLPDSVILWTRLVAADADEQLAGDVDVEWEIATDREFSEIVNSGVATASTSLGHSVHVEADGLEPDREYWYRFRVGDFETDPARTRTFAAPGTTPERFRFAFSSCQNWEQGYYAAYRDLVEQGDIDAFVFLGDYIYEYASGGYADERGRTTGQDFECQTIEQYRAR